MLARRHLLPVLIPVLICNSPLRGWGGSGPDRAGVFIQGVGNEIRAIFASPGALDERRRRLQALIERVVDVDGAARFCLGRFWSRASPAQQHDYVRLFHAALMNAVLARMTTETTDRSDVRVTVSRSEIRDDGTHVPTVVERSGNPPLQVTWVVSPDLDRPRLIDVIAEGTSLRLTMRSDYTGFLIHHNEDVDTLLKALRAQVCDDCAAATPSAAR